MNTDYAPTTARHAAIKGSSDATDITNHRITDRGCRPTPASQGVKRRTPSSSFVGAVAGTVQNSYLETWVWGGISGGSVGPQRIPLSAVPGVRCKYA